MNVRHVLGLLGRSRHSDLCGTGEVIKDLPPGGVIVSTSAVAFIHDNEVEESRRKLTEEFLAFFRPCDRLIEAEVDLVRGIDPPLVINRLYDLGGGIGIRLDRP